MTAGISVMLVVGSGVAAVVAWALATAIGDLGPVMTGVVIGTTTAALVATMLIIAFTVAGRLSRSGR